MSRRLDLVAALIVLPMSLLASPAAGADSSPSAPRDDTRLVYKQEGKHCAFPNLLLLQNGDLLVHFRLGLTHAGENGVIAQVRSTDSGKTWSDARVVASHPELDFRTSSCGIQLPDGRILLPFYPYVAERTPHSHPGPLMIVSDDNGQTWSDPIKLPERMHADADDTIGTEQIPRGRWIGILRSEMNAIRPHLEGKLGIVVHDDGNRPHGGG